MKELKREKYLSRIRPFYRDSDIIKVLTGVRGSGKSTIMRQIMAEIGSDVADDRALVYIDLDSRKNQKITTIDLLEGLIDSEFGDRSGERYLFIDGIQNVRDFEPLINAYRNDGVSVFITGSNSYLFSGELVTKLTGRYVEFRIFTFSLNEVRSFYQENAMDFNPTDAFRDYILTGGYPKSFAYADPEDKARYVRSVVSETIKRDILGSGRVRDRVLLDRVLNHVLFIPGTGISSTSVADHLRSEHIMTTPNTVNRYLDLIFASMLADRCMRYDIITGKVLKTHYKSYVADISLHTSHLGNRYDPMTDLIIKNVVFNELLSRGYDVRAGKFRDTEVDFVVSNGRDSAYIQVTKLISSSEDEEMEERPFLGIRDNYPKYIISMDPVVMDHKGIRRLRLIEDFLLGDGFRL